jgi:integration host factor subunit alpha
MILKEDLWFQRFLCIFSFPPQTPIEFAQIHQDLTLIFEEQSMTLTKAQIVEALLAQNIFSRTQSAQVIDTMFELIKQSLQDGEDVLISGFGRFSVKEKRQRIGRHPQTAEPITLPPRKVVTFKCSDVLRAAMKGEVDQGVRIATPFRSLSKVEAIDSIQKDKTHRPHPTVIKLAFPSTMVPTRTIAIRYK